jgi:hypothetical protein
MVFIPTNESSDVDPLAVPTNSVYLTSVKFITLTVCKQAYSCRMWDKMLLNGAEGPDDELWGLNAPFGFGAPERKAAAWLGLGNAQKAIPVGADGAVR